MLKELRERATQLVEDARTEKLRNALLKRQQEASAERSEHEVSRIRTALGKADHVKCLHTTIQIKQERRKKRLIHRKMYQKSP